MEANSAEKALVLPKEDNVATAPLSIQEVILFELNKHYFSFMLLWNWHINCLPSGINVVHSIASSTVSLVAQTILMAEM